MTRLFVLGSGSKGNAFALETPAGVVVVDAGFGLRAFRRRAALAGLPDARIIAVLLTHEHGDHATGALSLAAAHGAPVLCSMGTWRGLGPADGVEHVVIRPTHPLQLAGITIHSCLTTHDATEPLALAVESPDGARTGFAVDIGRPTAAVRYLLRGANVVVMESNYDELMLRTGRYPPSVQQRIAGSGGHVSNRAAAGLLADLVHEGLSAVVLAHLSQQCNSSERARATVEPLLRARGFRGTVHVAPQDQPLPPISVPAAPYRDQGELPLRWDEGSPVRLSSG